MCARPRQRLRQRRSEEAHRTRGRRRHAREGAVKHEAERHRAPRPAKDAAFGADDVSLDVLLRMAN